MTVIVPAPVVGGGNQQELAAGVGADLVADLEAVGVVDDEGYVGSLLVQVLSLMASVLGSSWSSSHSW